MEAFLCGREETCRLEERNQVLPGSSDTEKVQSGSKFAVISNVCIGLCVWVYLSILSDL